MTQPINDPQKWTTLETKYLYKEPWLTVRKQRMQMPNGNIVPEYYVLEYPEWISVIAITRDDRFVLIRQYRPGIERTCFELCAGVCDETDASPLESAKRELWEETGYGNGTWQEYLVSAPNASSTNNYSHCFLAQGVEKIDSQHLEDSEDITVHLLSFDEVKEVLYTHEIVQATMTAPLWKYVAERESGRII